MRQLKSFDVGITAITECLANFPSSTASSSCRRRLPRSLASLHARPLSLCPSMALPKPSYSLYCSPLWLLLSWMAGKGKVEITHATAPAHPALLRNELPCNCFASYGLLPKTKISMDWSWAFENMGEDMEHCSVNLQLFLLLKLAADIGWFQTIWAATENRIELHQLRSDLTSHNRLKLDHFQLQFKPTCFTSETPWN